MQIANLELQLLQADAAAHSERVNREQVIQQLMQEKCEAQQSWNEQEAKCLALQQQVTDAQFTLLRSNEVSSLGLHLVIQPYILVLQADGDSFINV